MRILCNFINFFFTFLFSIQIFSSTAAHEAYLDNKIFEGKQNAISISVGKNINPPYIYENINIIDIVYAQPNTFFRIDGAKKVELFSIHVNNNPKYDDLVPEIIFGLSQSIYLFKASSWFAELGVGIYMQTKVTSRISSGFTFGERFSIGYKFQSSSLEIYLRHLSNAGITEENHGYNPQGITYSYYF